MTTNRFSASVCIAVLSGCGSTTAWLADETAPAVVDSALETASTPENVYRINELVAGAVSRDPSVVDATLRRLAAPENAEHVRTITRRIASVIIEEVTDPSSIRVKKGRDDGLRASTKIIMSAAAEETKLLLPSIIQAVAADPGVQSALVPLSRSAGQGATQGAGDAITGNGAGRE